MPAAIPAPRAVRGVVTVELALVLLVFLTVVIGTLEISRLLFLLNTLQEVTRLAARGAAVTDFAAPDEIAAMKRAALMRGASGSDGPLPLAPNLGPDQVRIEYLNAALAPASPQPGCPLANLRNCTLDPAGANCIRFVRASICAGPDGACNALPYQPMTGLVPAFAGIALPVSSTLQKAESLGYRPGRNSCPLP